MLMSLLNSEISELLRLSTEISELDSNSKLHIKMRSERDWRFDSDDWAAKYLVRVFTYHAALIRQRPMFAAAAAILHPQMRSPNLRLWCMPCLVF